MKPALFLDRDGTINAEVGPIASPDALQLLPRAARAIRDAVAAGLECVIVTNQSAIARGLLDERQLKRVHARLADLLAAEGASIAGIYHCPHHPDHGAPPYRQACLCRKPRPGLFLEAAQDLALDLDRSYTVGDRGRDLEAGRAAGTRTVLVLTGYGQEEFEYHSRRGDADESPVADHVAADLLDAVQWILQRRKMEGRPS